MQAKNFAARAGRWSAQHRKTAIVGWLVFVVLAVFVGSSLGTKTISNDGTGSSGHADKVIDKAFPNAASESVMVQAKGHGSARDPQFQATVRAVEKAVSAQPGVQKVKSPYTADNAGQISKDGRSALVNFEIRGSDNVAADRVDGVLKSVAAVQSAHPQYTVERVRRRQRRQGDLEVVRGRLQEGGDPVAADHAADPRRRVRLARGGRHPACCSRSRPSSRRSA